MLKFPGKNQKRSDPPTVVKVRETHKLFNSETISRLSVLFGFLPPRRLIGLSVLLVISIASGLFDLIFIGLLARLVGSLTGSRLEDKIPNVLVFGGDHVNQGLWIVALVVGLVWLSMALRFCGSLIQSMLSAQIWADYGERIFSNVLLQKYEYFQSQNTAHMLARLNRILSRVSDDLVLPILTVASSTLSVSVLAVGIIVSFGLPAILIFGFLLLAYIVSSFLITKPLRFAVKQKINFSMRVNSLLMESTKSIRDVQLYGSESFYIHKFHLIGARGKKYDRIARLLPDIPRYIIEPSAITLIFAVVLLPILLNPDQKSLIKDAVPLLTAVLFASIKLSAPIQAIFRSINKLRGSLPDIVDALGLLQLTPRRIIVGYSGAPSPEGVMPSTSIRLDNISYRYPQSSDWVIDGVSLNVPIGSRIALVGQTGGGKTTVAHLLLGLLEPQKGKLLLDGIELLPEELPSWQACCAFVPQNISLLDASIRENVAFGIDDDCIQDGLVWEALEMAQLDDFVAELPYGVYTVVGEDGMRLSGGQRQRLALARAFYKQAKVLVLDEATSALDNKTENDVLEALELVGRRCTTLVIAHRLSTIRSCDRIYEFQRGMIKAFGTYELLQERSESFRQLVALQDG